MCWNKGRLCWKIANLFHFCHLKKLVRPATFGPYHVLMSHYQSTSSTQHVRRITFTQHTIFCLLHHPKAGTWLHLLPYLHLSFCLICAARHRIRLVSLRCKMWQTWNMRLPNFYFLFITSPNGRYSLVTCESHKVTLSMYWKLFVDAMQAVLQSRP